MAAVKYICHIAHILDNTNTFVSIHDKQECIYYL